MLLKLVENYNLVYFVQGVLRDVTYLYSLIIIFNVLPLIILMFLYILLGCNFYSMAS